MSAPTSVDPSHTIAATAIEAVFEAILTEIVRGHYPAGARLPAERELSRQLGASRPTLREALRRLGEWNLVEPRRGSGVVVRPMHEWSIEVLPAYLRWGRPGAGQPTIARMLVDLLALRRALFVDVIRLVAARLGPGDTVATRAALDRAWALRGQPHAFQREDFQVIRAVCEAAGLLPALWVMNRVAGVYLEVADAISTSFAPPPDYHEAHSRFLDALDAGDADAACAIVADYLERHDRALVSALEVFA
jgi:GntR family transcriptional regulator, transcriptional repressor for pyruvate dehydrogenase complex